MLWAPDGDSGPTFGIVQDLRVSRLLTPHQSESFLTEWNSANRCAPPAEGA